MKILFKVLLVIVACWPLSAFAQGVDFRTAHFTEATEWAAKEDKFIFIDFYTTWCGPCKKMSEEVFTQKKVGDYLNAGFVCLKIDAEKGEGKTLAVRYAVRAYPTFLVLKPDGKEVYRSMGASPADEFVEKIRKGIDPEWSPEGLTERYRKGERTPQLINDYALLLLEGEGQEAGFKVLNDYFNSLSPKKKMKPENLFLYARYALNLEDIKARYLFDHKDGFIQSNGRDTINGLLYNWLRLELIPYVSLRSAAPVTADGLQKVKADLAKAGLAETGAMPALLAIAEVRVTGNMERYLAICREKFPVLEVKDRFLILLNMSELSHESDEVKKQAAALIRKNINVTEGLNRRILRMQMLNLEGKNEFTFRADIEGAESGKAVVMGWTPNGNLQDTFEFRNHRIEFELTGRDTAKVTLKIVCEPLGCVTQKLGTYYPNVELMFVPGELAVIKIHAEKGKVPQVKWIRGGDVGHDYYRLNYEQVAPEEAAYRQLSMNNLIEGGDIRNYKTELEAYLSANKEVVMTFVRNNPQSFVSVMQLQERYNWFDENETEQIYNQFLPATQRSLYGRAIKQKLDGGRAYRTGSMAPEFVKTDMNGKPVSLKTFRGKYVLLDFWGSWCGPCRASHPHLKVLHQKYGKQMQFIHVANENVKDPVQARKLWKQAVKEDGMTWTQILNNEKVEDYDLLKLYHITSFPTKVLIDPDGRIAAKFVGSSGDPEEMLEQIFGE